MTDWKVGPTDTSYCIHHSRRGEQKNQSGLWGLVWYRAVAHTLIRRWTGSNPVLSSPKAGETELIGVGIDCFDIGDCSEMTCKTVACVDYECIYTNASQGTSCDDDLFCTETDECDGNGNCAGSANPCSFPTPVCNEVWDRCDPLMQPPDP